MKTSFLLIVSVLFFSACNSNDNSIEINSTNEISFQIEKSNSASNFISNVQSFELKQKSSKWKKTTQENIEFLIKEILYDVTLENGEVIEFGLWFAKFDGNKDLLTLELDGPNSFQGINWDYISSVTESEDFYKKCEIRVLINQNVIFTHSNNDNLNIINIEPIIVDGVEKSFLSIDLYGIAKGWYDPDGTLQEVYELSNGYFQGIIE